MSSLLRGNIRMAIASLRSTRWRSNLTMLGVVVAVVPVLTILSIGEGVKRQINDQINDLGSNLIIARPGQLINDGNPIEQFNALNGYSNAGTFTKRDLNSIESTKTLAHVSPLGIVPGAITVNDATKRDTFVVASSQDLPSLINHSIQYGSFFKSSDYNRRTAVVGRGAAEKLFGDGIPLGRAFDFRDQTFIVGGVLERFDSTPLSFTADLNNAIIIPYPVAEDLAGQIPIYEILGRAKDPEQTKASIDKVNAALLKSRGGEKDFSVVTQAENTRVVNRILNLLTALVTGVAAIALLVSGISIMNIMLVSVTERMHEIGVRKAIGATRRQIIGQFMSEAIILSLAGGIIGIALSFLVEYFIRLWTDLEPVITWPAALLVGFLSLAVGAIFGSIPAIKAARKDPINALRYE